MKALRLLVVLLATLWMTSPAIAQDDNEARREEAKKLADSAYDLMTKGLYDDAIGLFRKADDKTHSPVFRVYISECYDKLGKLVTARNELMGVVDEQIPADAPEGFRRAQDDARARLAALDKRIPRVTLSVEGGSGDANVELDGKPVSAADLGGPIRVDPGSHQVRAVGGGRTGTKSFKITEGEQLNVSVSLGETGGGGIEPEPTPLPDPTPDRPSGGQNYVPAAVAFAIGGAGLIMGAVAGGIFIGRAGDLKDSCEADGDGDPLTCPPEQQEEIDDVSVLGNVSTAGWVIAGAGIAAGIILLFVPIGDDEATVSLRLAPTEVGVQGRF
jgi:hypothetical protein